MSLAKNGTIQAIGERTRMRNHDVQQVVEALIDVWFEELARGGKIEIEHFIVIEVKTIRRDPTQVGTLISNGRKVYVPTTRRQLQIRASRHLRNKLNPKFDP